VAGVSREKEARLKQCGWGFIFILFSDFLILFFIYLI